MKNPFEIYTSLNAGNNQKPLEWEESAVDAQSPVDDIHDAERSAPKTKWLWLVLFGAFLLLGGRIFYLQIIQGANFRLLANNNQIRSRVLLAPGA